jgi:hypothetical protein
MTMSVTVYSSGKRKVEWILPTDNGLPLGLLSDHWTEFSEKYNGNRKKQDTIHITPSSKKRWRLSFFVQPIA